jgi:beta-ribofuranosylaminobenzene 5'-phosphate synthase
MVGERRELHPSAPVQGKRSGAPAAAGALIEDPAYATGGRAAARTGVVRVDVPARLQMGLVDLRGDLGRLFGGLGVAVAEPRTELEVEPAAALDVEGPDGTRAETFARRFLEHHSLRGGARIRVQRAIPAHVGLGSGTQLALAVARGLAELHGLPADLASLVAAVGRGARSAVGCWTFDRGGLVVDGGRRVGGGGRGDEGSRLGSGSPGSLAPLIGRYPMPVSWHCVVAIPAVEGGLSGEDERAAFERLPLPPAELVGRISHLLLMGVLPALLEEDLVSFGRAMGELQRLVGECFAPVQGSTYAGPEVTELVRRLEESGAAGVGQSSWGPTVYGFVEGAPRAAELAERIQQGMGPGGGVFATAFDNQGARVTRLSGPPPGTEPDV